ncbi:MAG: hypothetical protein RMM10_13205, partial [Anaerolineae bacterium]|uniref:hypothetical protein n=1 Tax=Thermoflexus sp. TaxID=1969742 RepID=UPI00260141C8
EIQVLSFVLSFVDGEAHHPDVGLAPRDGDGIAKGLGEHFLLEEAAAESLSEAYALSSRG